MRQITLTVNDRHITLEVEEGETLLEVIREKLGLAGTKKGCEVGECGACTVLLDGVPVTSCLLLAAEADGRSIVTIEGLSKGRELHPLQKAFVDKGAIQCGFCTPGMVLSAWALLKENPDPTAEDVKKGLAGNLCRCAAYAQIIEAVLEAAKTMADGKGKTDGIEGRVF